MLPKGVNKNEKCSYMSDGKNLEILKNLIWTKLLTFELDIKTFKTFMWPFKF